MLAIFQPRKADHPDGNRYTLVDTRTGHVAEVDGIPQVSLPFDDADDLANHLNYVATQNDEQPPLEFGCLS